MEASFPSGPSRLDPIHFGFQLCLFNDQYRYAHGCSPRAWKNLQGKVFSLGVLKDSCKHLFWCDRRWLSEIWKSLLSTGMVSNSSEGTSVTMDRAGMSLMKPSTDQTIWVSSEPLLDEVEELARCYPEVVELPEEEVRVQTEEWLAKGLIAKTLGRKVSMEAAAWEF